MKISLYQASFKGYKKEYHKLAILKLYLLYMLKYVGFNINNIEQYRTIINKYFLNDIILRIFYILRHIKQKSITIILNMKYLFLIKTYFKV